MATGSSGENGLPCASRDRCAPTPRWQGHSDAPCQEAGVIKAALCGIARGGRVSKHFRACPGATDGSQHRGLAKLPSPNLLS